MSRIGGSTDPLFNVPIVTEEEERAERETLSEIEQLQLQVDLYGCAERRIDQRRLVDGTVSTLFSASHETQEEITLGIAAMNEAIDGIPESEKADYLQAREFAPNLIDTESPPADFLRCEHYNSTAAAIHLVSYWRQRKTIFGATLAFLPLRLDGALRDDVDFLEQGYLLPLPADSHGRPVVLVDRTGLSQIRGQPTPSVLRIMMYLTHAVTCHIETSESKRVVHIANMQVCATL